MNNCSKGVWKNNSHLPFLFVGKSSSSVVDLDLFLKHRTQYITYVSLRTSVSYFWRTPKRLPFNAVDLFPMSTESYIYFHTKEFFHVAQTNRKQCNLWKREELMTETDTNIWKSSPIIWWLSLWILTNLCTFSSRSQSYQVVQSIVIWAPNIRSDCLLHYLLLPEGQ